MIVVLLLELQMNLRIKIKENIEILKIEVMA
jgi:hypothetical protein